MDFLGHMIIENLNPLPPASSQLFCHQSRNLLHVFLIDSYALPSGKNLHSITATSNITSFVQPCTFLHSKKWIHSPLPFSTLLYPPSSPEKSSNRFHPDIIIPSGLESRNRRQPWRSRLPIGPRHRGHGNGSGTVPSYKHGRNERHFEAVLGTALTSTADRGQSGYGDCWGEGAEEHARSACEKRFELCTCLMEGLEYLSELLLHTCNHASDQGRECCGKFSEI